MMKSTPEVDPLLTSWTRSLRAAGKSPATIESYSSAVASFTAWCVDNGVTTDPAKQRRADVENYIGWQLETRSRGTAGVRFRSLRQWFRWLEAEEEATDLTAGMKHPKLETKVVPVIAAEHLSALLEVTSRKPRDFMDRRDHAIISVLIDTGMRRGELVGLTLADVNLDSHVLHVQRSKTGTARIAPIGDKTIAALDRYIRLRSKHRLAKSPSFWLGLHGPLTGEGVRQMLMVRSRQAGIPEVYPHQFRHTFGHVWRMKGGSPEDLASLAGWAPGSAMLARYGASAAGERARDAHRRLSPRDSL